MSCSFSAPWHVLRSSCCLCLHHQDASAGTARHAVLILIINLHDFQTLSNMTVWPHATSLHVFPNIARHHAFMQIIDVHAVCCCITCDCGLLFFCCVVDVLTALQSTSRSPSGFDCAPSVRLLSVMSIGNMQVANRHHTLLCA